jgi:hypothetical protein
METGPQIYSVYIVYRFYARLFGKELLAYAVPVVDQTSPENFGSHELPKRNGIHHNAAFRACWAPMRPSQLRLSSKLCRGAAYAHEALPTDRPEQTLFGPIVTFCNVCCGQNLENHTCQLANSDTEQQTTTIRHGIDVHPKRPREWGALPVAQGHPSPRAAGSGAGYHSYLRGFTTHVRGTVGDRMLGC